LSVQSVIGGDPRYHKNRPRATTTTTHDDRNGDRSGSLLPAFWTCGESGVFGTTLASSIGSPYAPVTFRESQDEGGATASRVPDCQSLQWTQKRPLSSLKVHLAHELGVSHYLVAPPPDSADPFAQFADHRPADPRFLTLDAVSPCDAVSVPYYELFVPVQIRRAHYQIRLLRTANLISMNAGKCHW